MRGSVRATSSREVPAVGARIADQLVALVKSLREFQCPLRAKAVQAVGVPLQFRQIIQQRRRHALGLRLDAIRCARRPCAARVDNRLRLVAVRRQPLVAASSGCARPGGTMCPRTSSPSRGEKVATTSR